MTYTALDSFDDIAQRIKFKKNCDAAVIHIRDPKAVLLYAMDETISYGDIKPLSLSLLEVLEASSSTLRSICALIALSIQNFTEDHKTLMRLDSVCSTLMTAYALGPVERQYSFLCESLGPLIMSYCSDETAARVGVDTEEEQQATLAMVEKFRQAIFNNPKDFPMPLRIIANTLMEEASKRGFDQVRSRLVGGFLLLRFICSAIVNPGSFLVDEDGVPYKVPAHAQPGLVLMSRLIQSMSNQTMPRSQNMAFAHDYLKEKMGPAEEFLIQVATLSQEEMDGFESPKPQAVTITRNALTFIHDFLVSESPRLLQVVTKPSSSGKVLASGRLQILLKSFQETAEMEANPPVKPSSSRKKEKKGKGTRDELAAGGGISMEIPGKLTLSTGLSGDSLVSVTLTEEEFEVFKSLVLDRSSHFVTVMDLATEHSDIRPLSATVMGVLEAKNMQMPIILELIQQTVEAHARDEDEGIAETTIMRKDSICSTLMTLYAQGEVEKRYNYVENLLRGLVTEVSEAYGDRNSLGLDTAEEQAELLVWADRFRERVFSAPDAVPPPLRRIARRLRDVANDNGFGSNVSQIVGGFLMLRVVGPSIVNTPKSWLQKPNISPAARIALVNISKLLQNMANRTIPRSEKMEFAVEFVKQHTEEAEGFLYMTTELVEAGEDPAAEGNSPEPPAAATEYLKEFLLRSREEMVASYKEFDYAECAQACSFLCDLEEPPAKEEAETERKNKKGFSILRGDRRKKGDPNVLSGDEGDTLSVVGSDRKRAKTDHRKHKKGDEGKKKKDRGKSPIASPMSSPEPKRAKKKKGKKSGVPSEQSPALSPITTRVGVMSKIQRDHAPARFRGALRGSMLRCEELGELHPLLVMIGAIEKLEISEIRTIFVDKGVESQVKKIIRNFESSFPDTDVPLHEYTGNSIGKAMLEVLEEIPISLIPFNTMDDLIEVLAGDVGGHTYLRLPRVLSHIPPTHGMIFVRFFCLLARVSVLRRDDATSPEEARNLIASRIARAVVHPDREEPKRAGRFIDLTLLGDGDSLRNSVRDSGRDSQREERNLSPAGMRSPPIPHSPTSNAQCSSPLDSAPDFPEECPVENATVQEVDKTDHRVSSAIAKLISFFE